MCVLTRSGHRSPQWEGVLQITPADKWVSNGVFIRAPLACLQGEEGMWTGQVSRRLWFFPRPRHQGKGLNVPSQLSQSISVVSN